MYWADVNSTSFYGSLMQMLSYKEIVELVVWDALIIDMPKVQENTSRTIT